MRPLLALAGRPRPQRPPEWSDAARESAARVLASCAAREGITPEAARRLHTPSAVRARRDWIRLVRASWDLSASATARLCGVDHASVLVACR